MVKKTGIPKDDTKNKKDKSLPIVTGDSEIIPSVVVDENASKLNDDVISDEEDSAIIDDYDKELFADDSDNDLFENISGLYQIWGNWAYFELSILTPEITPNTSVVIIHPENIPGGEELEFVYPIFDYGNKLSSSKGSDMYATGISMCKLYYTIEKMIAILIERLKNNGVSDTEIESKVAFDGHQLAQRKAFESIINLSYNVVVSNFDPGEWGEKYLVTIKNLADKGYGYPTETPRDIYKKHIKSTIGVKGSRSKGG